MNHKLGICIPYRNRKEHLDKLIPHLSAHLTNKNIEHKFYVGHQVDDKLFNRGSMKNIAAQKAFEDGCDYIAWHDVDMLPHDECDYRYPEKTPLHIATKLSKYNYGLGYTQYFGGVVLFNKEQVNRTNGYSNEYWDWGQEDDDLFWRCYFEEYTTGKILQNYNNRRVAYFNGENASLELNLNREVNSCLNQDFTISLLVNPEQQIDKVPIWLIGDTNKRFIEYPILRKDGSHTWGISFNNSRAITMLLLDKNNRIVYNWGKRHENLWTWVTIAYSKDRKEVYFYINDELTSQMNGTKQSTPFPVFEELRRHDSIKPFVIGKCPQMNTFFKGKVAEIKVYNSFKKNVKNGVEDNQDLVLHYNFDIGVKDLINEYEIKNDNVDFINENIEIIENIVPYRKEGRFVCLPHEDEGFVNGKWAKGETTAKNERRFVTEMQQNKINYKEDGINKINDVTEVVSLDTSSYSNTIIINTKMI